MWIIDKGNSILQRKIIVRYIDWAANEMLSVTKLLISTNPTGQITKSCGI